MLPVVQVSDLDCICNLADPERKRQNAECQILLNFCFPQRRQTDTDLQERQIFMENILNLPQAEHFIRSATENHARISEQEKGGD